MPMAGAVSAAVVGVRSDLAQAIWHPSEAFLAGPDLLQACDLALAELVGKGCEWLNGRLVRARHEPNSVSISGRS